MKITFTNHSRLQLRIIFNYYKEVASLSVSERIVRSIIARIQLLLSQPDMGAIEPTLSKLGLSHRYIIYDNYKIIYRVTGQIIFITDVFDTRQDVVKMKG